MPYTYCEQIDTEIRDISDEVPFEIPESWEWVRLGSIVYNRGQIKPISNFCYIDIGSIDNKHQKLSVEENIISPDKAPSRARKIIDIGDIIYSTVRPYLHNMCIIDRQFSLQPIASTGFATMTCYDGLFNKFLLYYLLAPDFDNYANDTENSKGVAYPAINDNRLYKAFIPIPPVEEQHRIVTKIEKLLPYIEKYEQAETQLSTLNANFPEALKKSILQEAVQGKLVPQNPDDEPASVLLEHIRVEKQALIKAGKIKKDKHESVIVTRDKIPYEIIDGNERCIADEVPFQIPDSWCWCRLGSISWYFDAGKSPNCIKQSVSGEEYGVITTTSIQLGFFDETQNKILPPNFNVNLDMKINKGDVLITRAGPMNRTGIACVVKNIHYNLILSDKTIRINLSDSLFDKDYIVIILNSPIIREQIIRLMSGMDKQQVNISQDKYKTVLLPLPPLTEQHRIVAKIEQLMKYYKML